MSEAVKEGSLDLSERIDIRNQKGEILFSLRFGDVVEVVGASKERDYHHHNASDPKCQA